MKCPRCGIETKEKRCPECGTWIVWRRPKIKHLVPTRWGWVVSHPSGLKLGKNVDIGFGTFIMAKYGVEIGDNVQIGSHCAIYSYNTIGRTIKGKVIIENDAQIGSFSLIMPNTRIKRGVKIPAYSFVKPD